MLEWHGCTVQHFHNMNKRKECSQDRNKIRKMNVNFRIKLRTKMKVRIQWLERNLIVNVMQNIKIDWCEKRKQKTLRWYQHCLYDCLNKFYWL